METRLKANFDHDNDQFWVKTKQLVGKMTAQAHNRFVSCVVIVEFAVNGNQALSNMLQSAKIWINHSDRVKGVRTSKTKHDQSNPITHAITWKVRFMLTCLLF